MSALSFATPAALIAGVGAAIAITLLHLLARQRPPRALLPTARFVPEGRATATSRARRPNDLLLLALRIATVLLAAAAFARPTLTPERRALARVFLLDRSRAVASATEGARAIRARWREGDLVIAFDTTATTLSWPLTDSALRVEAGRPGSLSVGLAAALRALPELERGADSLELVIVSPLAVDEFDRASPRLRALWPGSVRMTRIERRQRSASGRGGLDVRASPDDPLFIAAALAGAGRFEAPARLVRDSSSRADSAWAATEGGAVVRWPSSAAPRAEWVARVPADSSGAIEAEGVVVVAPFLRRWKLDGGIARARWADGEPAAVERDVGEGCIRDVAIDVPTTGDLVLTPAFGRLLRALAGACTNTPAAASLPDSALTWLTQGQRAAPRQRFVPDAPSRLAAWLFGVALVLALLELLLRRRRAGTGVAERANGGSVQSPGPSEHPAPRRAVGGDR